MTRTADEIRAYFCVYVFGYIFADIDSIIRGKANYSAALCLMSYTEFLGGLIDGSLGDREQPSADRFNAALDYFEWNGDPNYYKIFKVPFRDVDSTVKDGNIYALFRCGLAHEYFIKADSLVQNHPRGSVSPEEAGVQIVEHEGKRRLMFRTNAYFRDFKAAWERYYKKLMDGDESPKKSFNLALDRVEAREILF
jgi:hypothetical protein